MRNKKTDTQNKRMKFLYKIATSRERRRHERLRTLRRKTVRALKTLRQAESVAGTRFVRWVLRYPKTMPKTDPAVTPRPMHAVRPPAADSSFD